MNLVYAMLCLSFFSKAYQEVRVIGGVDDVKEFPYVVGIASRENMIRTCTGSMIKEEWVLTAAHCVSDQDVQRVVIFGNMSVPPDLITTYSKVLNQFKHHSFNSRFLENDIGLLLVERVPVKVFGKVSAVDYLSMLGKPVRYVGLGTRSKLGVNNHTEIRRPTWPRQIGEAVVVGCDKKRIEMYRGPYICVRAKCVKKNQIFNKGDSGGPLILYGKITGVACCLPKKTRWPPREDVIGKFMFTPVGLHLDWILSVISNNTN